MRPPYRTIESAILRTSSHNAGGSKTATLAFTRSTLAAGVLLYVCRYPLNAPFHDNRWQKQSSTCVPNPATWPLLTPIYNPDICSLDDERWELRGNELGCKVSTRTFLSVVIAVLGTVFLISAGWGLIRFWEWSSIRWRGWLKIGRARAAKTKVWMDEVRLQSLKELFRSWGRKNKAMIERDGWIAQRQLCWKRCIRLAIHSFRPRSSYRL